MCNNGFKVLPATHTRTLPAFYFLTRPKLNAVHFSRGSAGWCWATTWHSRVEQRVLALRLLSNQLHCSVLRHFTCNERVLGSTMPLTFYLYVSKPLWWLSDNLWNSVITGASASFSTQNATETVCRPDCAQTFWTGMLRPTTFPLTR